MGKTFMQNFCEIKEHVMCINNQSMGKKTNFAFQFEIIGEGASCIIQI